MSQSSQSLVHISTDAQPAVLTWPDEFENAGDVIAHEILTWQDEWLLEIPRQWMALYQELAEFAESKVADMGFWAQLGKSSFFDEQIKPEMQMRCNRLENRLHDDIQASLNERLNQLKQQIVIGSDAWHGQSGNFNHEGMGSLEIIGRSAPPAIAGAATIPWMLGGAVVSKGGLLGLLGATTVAWPVVLGGAAIVGISAFALGDQTKRMFAKSKDKFIDGIRAHFWQMMVANDQENALAQQMQKTVLHFSRTLIARANGAPGESR